MTKKIALVGPTYPYRGGIAQYTNELYDALKKEGDVKLYSFKRLYPSWLYPGDSDKEVGGGTIEAELIVDVYNPFSLYKLCREIEKQGCEVAIITWWTLFWQPGMTYVVKRLSKKGIKTVFLCHNLYDHGGNGLKQKISKKLLAASDAYIVHSSDEEETLHEIFPGKPVFQRLLPVYTQFPVATKKLKKRGDLELLFFGFIRPYKGLDVLLEALPKLKNEVHLTIIGEYWGERNELEEKIKTSGYKNIETHIEYVSTEDAANYFERADVVVLPYLSATGSAVLSVAYYYGVPVVASAAGGLKDGVIDGKTGWLVAPGSSDDLTQTINGITRMEAASLKPSIQDFCKQNSWAVMARSVKDFAENL